MSKNLRAIHKTLFKPHISLQAALASLQRESVPEESYAVWIHTGTKTQRQQWNPTALSLSPIVHSRYQ